MVGCRFISFFIKSLKLVLALLVEDWVLRVIPTRSKHASKNGPLSFINFLLAKRRGFVVKGLKKGPRLNDGYRKTKESSTFDAALCQGES